MSSRRLRAVASLGPALSVVLPVGYLVLWLAAKPPSQPTNRYLGEFFGAEAVLLLSLSLALTTLLTPIERAFGGLDRVGIWHRRVAVAGVVLLVPHVALVTSPPSRYATTMGMGLGVLAFVGLVFLAH